MNTTNYILELLIAGICTFIWMILGCMALWGSEISLDTSHIENADKIYLGLALAPIIYVFGVISDRIIDALFDKLFQLRKKYFPDIEEYRQARSTVYIKSETLTKLFEYGRMRIRICRSWTVNGLLILIPAIMYLWSQHPLTDDASTRAEITFVLFLVIFVSIMGSFYAWRKLNIKEFEFLKIQVEVLRNQVNS